MGVYSNLAAHVATESTDGNVALLDFMCEATAADTAMFNSIIELDLQEAAAKADGGSYITESDTGSKDVQEKLSDKIKAFLSRVWNAIKTAFESIVAKIQEAFGADKRLIAKYNDVTDADVTGADIKVTIISVASGLNDLAYKSQINDYNNTVTSTIETIGKAKRSDQIDKLTQTIEADIKKINDGEGKKADRDKFEAQYKTVVAKDATGEDKASLMHTFDLGKVYLKNGYSNIIKSLTDAKKNVLSNIEAHKRDVDIQKKEENASDTPNEVKVKKLSAQYTILTKYYSAVSQDCSRIISYAKQNVLVCRGTYIRLAKWGYDHKNSSKKATGEAAEIYGELSDLFVEDALDI